MKRLRKIIFNCLCGLSMLLCAGTVVLWVVSCSSDIRPPTTLASGKSCLLSWRGQLVLMHHHCIEQTVPGMTVLTTAKLVTERHSSSVHLTVEVRSTPREEWDAELDIHETTDMSRRVSGSWSNGGFGWSTAGVTSTRISTPILSSAAIPYWILTMLFASPVAWWVWDRCRSVRRRHAGLCLICGYDLRATPDRCPECGTHASAKGSA
jgi:hypothetical protein